MQAKQKKVNAIGGAKNAIGIIYSPPLYSCCPPLSRLVLNTCPKGQVVIIVIDGNPFIV